MFPEAAASMRRKDASHPIRHKPAIQIFVPTKISILAITVEAQQGAQK
jgi:hypothetical protein